MTSNRYYDPATGRLKTLDTSMLASFGVVQDHEYDWDNIGNLTERTRTTGSNTLQETFVYDGLNRLRHVKVGGAIQQNIQYYKNGNIKSKTGVGTYTYGNNAGPHAVTNTSTGNISYTYDANGNMTSDTSGRSLQYTTFDKPKLISKGGHTTEFKYGPNRARYLRTDTDSNGTTVTRYIGSVEKVTKADGSQVIKRYIGDALVTISKSSSGTETARTTQYLYKDHLGSLDVIVEGGNTQEYRFDAWGQRINPSTSAVLANIATDINFSVANIATTRGFTGHEMLDQVGLIHMNGRIYDARLGRFLQADTVIQFPDYTQGYNRYSYVLNNPLNMTDPSGHILPVIVGAIAAAAGATAVEIAIYVGVAAFTQTLAQGGSFGDALISGVSAAALTYMGATMIPGASTFGDYAIAVVSMGTVGGITSTLQGGKFGHGFVSAGIGGALGGKVGGALGGGLAGNVIGGAIVGGTMSKVTGGKFANGARYGAFVATVNWAAGRAVRTTGQINNPEVSIETDIKLRDNAINNMNVDETLPEVEIRAMSQDPVYTEELIVTASRIPVEVHAPYAGSRLISEPTYGGGVRTANWSLWDIANSAAEGSRSNFENAVVIGVGTPLLALGGAAVGGSFGAASVFAGMTGDMALRSYQGAPLSAASTFTSGSASILIGAASGRLAVIGGGSLAAKWTWTVRGEVAAWGAGNAVSNAAGF
ncbi:MAG: hypothetical protein GYB33_09885 [Gammaproteobacteria bacterium]|nr:hypothetical protein [Gammaproteobacteria bacterium]